MPNAQIHKHVQMPNKCTNAQMLNAQMLNAQMLNAQMVNAQMLNAQMVNAQKHKNAQCILQMHKMQHGYGQLSCMAIDTGPVRTGLTPKSTPIVRKYLDTNLSSQKRLT